MADHVCPGIFWSEQLHAEFPTSHRLTAHAADHLKMPGHTALATDDHIGLKVLQAPTDECLHCFVDEGEGPSQGRGVLMPPEPRHTPQGHEQDTPGRSVPPDPREVGGVGDR